MGKKILFAVMALLVMATGKIWAEGETTEQTPTPYAVLCQNGTDDQNKPTYSMYFVYTTATVNTGGSGEITVGSGSNEKTLTYTKAWEIPPSGEISIMVDIWTKNPDGITQVVFEESFKDVKVTNCSNWFDGLKNLTEIIGIENLNTSKVTDMAWMFNGCEKLTSLDLSSFNTSGAAKTASMFRNCSSLGQITFGNNFKTSNTGSMFKGCSSLTSLVLSSFVTSQVTDMSDMFNGCSKLESLDLSSFNTSNVTNMESMFSDCGSLTKLNLSSFNTSMVTKMRNMFNGCSKLNYLTLGCFDMTREESVKGKNDMFDNSNITIRGNNVLVFVTSDTQKGVWEGFTGVNLMVKNGADKYVSDGTVDITLDNDEDTPVIFPHDFIANKVTFKRTFTAGKPHTVCLPFAITNTAAYGTFYELSGYDNGKVKFKKVDKTNGNTPYLFIPNTDGITTINVTGNVDISSTTGGGNAIADDYNTRFRGVYEKFTFTDEFLADNSDYNYYGWTKAGDFKKAGKGASVAPCRAYIKLAKGGAGIGSAPARLSVEFDDGETTGIDTIGTAKSGADGGANAPMYNLQGQRVGSGYKGVVIKNGKKMIVR